jgi:hypothetical protein
MARTEIVQVEMPDGVVIDAEVSVADSISDVGVRSRLHLADAKGSIGSFVRWAVSSVGGPGVESSDPAKPPGPEGMTLSRVEMEFGLKLAVTSGALTSVIASAGGEATAVVRLAWERAGAGE